MTESTKSVRGTFCWVELATDDPESALRFYGELFAWSAKPLPSPHRGGTYLLLQRDGKNVGGLMPMQRRDVRPNWRNYVAVDELERSLETAVGLGGKIVGGPMDAGGGRFAVLQDPAGHELGLWQDRPHAMAPWLSLDPGASCWFELITEDIETAGDFYGRLFGWTRTSATITGQPYLVFKNAGTNVAGMMAPSFHMDPTVMGWTVFFAVQNCEATTIRVQKMGGRLVRGPVDVRGTGRFASFQDPQGADFAILQQRPMGR
jgi:predicted enzyme related to lactoylglutathione lyase